MRLDFPTAARACVREKRRTRCRGKVLNASHTEIRILPARLQEKRPRTALWITACDPSAHVSTETGQLQRVWRDVIARAEPSGGPSTTSRHPRRRGNRPAKPHPASHGSHTFIWTAHRCVPSTSALTIHPLQEHPRSRWPKYPEFRRQNYRNPHASNVQNWWRSTSYAKGGRRPTRLMSLQYVEQLG
jgi:hypothetical protein